MESNQKSAFGILVALGAFLFGTSKIGSGSFSRSDGRVKRKKEVTGKSLREWESIIDEMTGLRAPPAFAGERTSMMAKHGGPETRSRSTYVTPHGYSRTKKEKTETKAIKRPPLKPKKSSENTGRKSVSSNAHSHEKKRPIIPLGVGRRVILP